MTPTKQAAPTDQQLAAVVEHVKSALDPDQIILFGSAVRSEMTLASDLDLLAIVAPETSEHAGRHDRWWNEAAGRDLDIFVATRAGAEAAKQEAGNPRGAALETGRTLYSRPESTPIRTGAGEVDEEEMGPQHTLYKPDRATQFLTRANRKWKRANDPTAHPVDRCEDLQVALEQALKGLTIAEGRQIAHTHDLNTLWDHAEAGGEHLPANRDRDQLQKLSLYAARYQYEDPTDGKPEETWTATRTTCRDIVEHARTRIPELIAATNSRLT